MTEIFTHAAARIKTLVRDQLGAACGHLRPQRIVLKPNWVMHETDPAFPIRALVTDPRIIEAAVESCLELFPDADSIVVGDCPLQSADWPRLCEQSGLNPIIQRLVRQSGRVAFRDLRREVFSKEGGTFITRSEAPSGDPHGYAEVAVGARSHLEPISKHVGQFGVNDYSAAVTSSNHQPGRHHYFVCRTILEADLLINLPKWKTHQKSAITAALKNLVGINADKAYLPHFRHGAPRWGGDEYPDAWRWLYWLQTGLRGVVQKRSELGYRLLKPGWELLKKICGLETHVTNPRATGRHVYAAGGSWPGNDTLWRMIYDLNLIAQCASAAGSLAEKPQRAYYCIVDGLVCGEGNGPIQSLPKEVDWLVFGDDPFAIDATLLWLMGFQPESAPVIAQRAHYSGPGWGQFALADLEVAIDGVRSRVFDSPLNLHFAPPPAWRENLER